MNESFSKKNKKGGMNAKDKISQLFDDILQSSCHSSPSIGINSPHHSVTMGSSGEAQDHINSAGRGSSGESKTLREVSGIDEYSST